MRRIDELLQRLRDASAALPAIEHPGPFDVPDERDPLALLEERVCALGPDGESSFAIVEDNDALLTRLRADYPERLRAEWVVGDESAAPMFYRFGLTEAHHLVARSGTIVLDVARALESLSSLVVEEHVVVASVDRVVMTLDQLPPLARGAKTRILISGPSRTADIEKTLVIPAHGPCRTALYLVRGTLDFGALVSRFFSSSDRGAG